MAEGPQTCKAVLAETLSGHKCLYWAGWDETEGLVSMGIADSEDADKMPVIAISIPSSGAVGDIIKVVLSGIWVGPSDFAGNAILYVDENGDFSTSPGTNAQRVGSVMRQHETDGRVYIYGCGDGT